MSEVTSRFEAAVERFPATILDEIIEDGSEPGLSARQKYALYGAGLLVTAKSVLEAGSAHRVASHCGTTTSVLRQFAADPVGELMSQGLATLQDGYLEPRNDELMRAAHDLADEGTYTFAERVSAWSELYESIGNPTATQNALRVLPDEETAALAVRQVGVIERGLHVMARGSDFRITPDVSAYAFAVSTAAEQSQSPLETGTATEMAIMTYLDPQSSHAA